MIGPLPSDEIALRMRCRVVGLGSQLAATAFGILLLPIIANCFYLI